MTLPEVCMTIYERNVLYTQGPNPLSPDNEIEIKEDGLSPIKHDDPLAELGTPTDEDKLWD